MTTAVFLGDSVTNGSGANSGATFYGAAMGARLGWTVTPKGVSSCGYIHGGANNYASRVAADVIALAPDVVVVQGSVNDSDSSGAAIQAAATALYATIRAGLPNALIYVVGLWLWATDSTAAYIAGTAAMAAACATAGIKYIDPYTLGWVTGTGHAGPSPALAGNGNADVYVYDTVPHPTQAGHDYLGTRLAFAIKPPATGIDF